MNFTRLLSTGCPYTGKNLIASENIQRLAGWSGLDEPADGQRIE